MRLSVVWWFLLVVGVVLVFLNDEVIADTKLRPSPLVIAHRGASAARPEETLAAYENAAFDRTDFLETDLCSTRDHHLICHHDCELSSTTNVASFPEFATLYRINPNRPEFPQGGWFTEDFTLADIKQLKARQLFSARSHLFDDLYQLLTLDEFLESASALSNDRNRTYGVYIETKHASYFASLGLPLEDSLLYSLNTSDFYSSRCLSTVSDIKKDGEEPSLSCPVFIQSFESTSLKLLQTLMANNNKTASKTTLKLSPSYPLIQLIGCPGDIQEDTKKPYSDMITLKGLNNIAKYAAGIGPCKTLLRNNTNNNNQEDSFTPTSLLGDAHDAGLLVHPWTFREDYYLAGITKDRDESLQQLASELQWYFTLGVDGVFTDLPDVAVAVRDYGHYSKDGGGEGGSGAAWRLPVVMFFFGFLVAMGMIAGIAECAKTTLSSHVVNPLRLEESDDGRTGSGRLVRSSSSSSETSSTSTEERHRLVASTAEV